MQKFNINFRGLLLCFSYTGLITDIFSDADITDFKSIIQFTSEIFYLLYLFYLF